MGLAMAIQRADLNQIKRHIAWGTDLNQPLADGRAPLLHAAEAGHVVIAQMLLKAGASVDARDAEGHDSIFLALKAGRPKVAEVLLKAGAKLEPDSLIHQLIAAGMADRDSIAFLRQQGANLNKPLNGKTLLNQAILEQRLEQAKQLILAGAHVDVADGAGVTPLQLANQLGNQDMIRLLMREGAGQ
jgi:ankyrin repeat protein